MWGYICVIFWKWPRNSVPSLYVRVYRCFCVLCNFFRVFPHYMWGYISCGDAREDGRGVPSLYVRVYRTFAYIPFWSSSSLIICEGISFTQFVLLRWYMFPHYMWGYIVKDYLTKGQQSVPSLYVRVYRLAAFFYSLSICSLIICEGISIFRILDSFPGLFPHYMWGYIDDSGNDGVYQGVPSLYVRVYRIKCTIKRTSAGSLIICEGISNGAWVSLKKEMFPHYMWGYIGKQILHKWNQGVPSLYVRVYRTKPDSPATPVCSLIICEGISLSTQTKAPSL